MKARIHMRQPLFHMASSPYIKYEHEPCKKGRTSSCGKIVAKIVRPFLFCSSSYGNREQMLPFSFSLYLVMQARHVMSHGQQHRFHEDVFPPTA